MGELKNLLDSIPLRVDQAQAVADMLSRTAREQWFPTFPVCRVEYVDEVREDRLADYAIGERVCEIRLFRGGLTVGSLIHEMSHNSVLCLREILMIDRDALSPGGGVHGKHFDLMFDFLTAVFVKQCAVPVADDK